MHFQTFIEIKPKAKPRPRFARGRAYTPASYMKYERHLADILRDECRKNRLNPDTGPVMLDLRFFFKVKDGKEGVRTKKPDLDNLVKSIKDAANGILYIDDAQVWACDAAKFTTKHREGIMIKCTSDLPINPMN